MKTIHFNKTECGVDFLINVLHDAGIAATYMLPEIHNSDYFEIIVFKRGNGYIFIDNRKIPIIDNSIVFISPFQLKKWEVDLDKLDFTILIFKEEFLNEFFADKLFTYKLLYFYQYDHPATLNSDQDKIQGICNILQEIKSELIAPNLDSAHIIRSLIYYILHRLNRDYAVENDLPFQMDSANHAYAFKKLLEEYIKEKQRVEDYSELLGISRISLNKAVKKQFHQTATQLLKNRLLTEIKNQLLYSGQSISEIAYGLGYSEPNHLMRFFKTQTGITASEFQSGYQNGSS
ncbi:AraC family transcriptional regulator [Flavobacterium suaedae]|uniref:AraC family transcriptional regulator n=1 Tax=Flavobacterium suaedae TaxID=1767027 RepID=A0ABQ1JML6_9FLAO|nr:AraC family transcriptional regulator [Flavobacterium suaedae]GGB72876.1 AraC family transcriptional regulator [Flavobacterium suaedae]